MPKIELETSINAPIDVVFDLSRSIDLHRLSTTHTREEAIAGVTSGLISLNESVTWRARHLGVYQTLSTKITEFNRPTFFVDEMIHGAFAEFVHQHYFEDRIGKTIMRDVFRYQSPFGILGQLADILFLKRYMTQFLTKRNITIREFAESERWKEIIEL